MFQHGQKIRIVASSEVASSWHGVHAIILETTIDFMGEPAYRIRAVDGGTRPPVYTQVTVIARCVKLIEPDWRAAAAVIPPHLKDQWNEFVTKRVMKA